ncbi:MAG: hypothetical protein ACI81P_002870, partial [Neolewinella sp.]
TQSNPVVRLSKDCDTCAKDAAADKSSTNDKSGRKTPLRVNLKFIDYDYKATISKLTLEIRHFKGNSNYL